MKSFEIRHNGVQIPALPLLTLWLGQDSSLDFITLSVHGGWNICYTELLWELIIIYVKIWYIKYSQFLPACVFQCIRTYSILENVQS